MALQMGEKVVEQRAHKLGRMMDARKGNWMVDCLVNSTVGQ